MLLSFFQLFQVLFVFLRNRHHSLQLSEYLLRLNCILVVMEVLHLLVYIVLLAYLGSQLKPQIISSVIYRCLLIVYEFVNLPFLTMIRIRKRKEETYTWVWLLWAWTSDDHLWNRSRSSFLPSLLLETRFFDLFHSF